MVVKNPSISQVLESIQRLFVQTFFLSATTKRKKTFEQNIRLRAPREKSATFKSINRTTTGD